METYLTTGQYGNVFCTNVMSSLLSILVLIFALLHRISQVKIVYIIFKIKIKKSENSYMAMFYTEVNLATPLTADHFGNLYNSRSKL